MKEEEWMKLVVERSGKKIKECNMFASIVTPKYLEDGKCALELGIAIYLNKPLAFIVQEGTELPSKLKLIADKVVTYKGPDDMGLAIQELAEWTKNFREENAN